ncbi:MAG: (2Fe-2S)-binding protein [Proteobacteria bacterium]|nr:(2Fe-2S)-binding protein [Pseudomonadota bacterium]MCP4919445.1 (2Fe-2S)-binding protein [Pseudomonadota bacterium]
MPRVTFRDLGQTLEAPEGQLLLDLCLDNGIEMEAACGGFAACNTCRVRVVSGELSPRDEVEDPFLDRPDQRLGCQAAVTGDVTLELDPGES